jgi:cysteine-rich repeat protein
MIRTWEWSVLLVVACAGFACEQTPGDPCAGVTCSDHGTCVSDGIGARCSCEPDYEPAGLECRPVGADADADGDGDDGADMEADVDGDAADGDGDDDGAETDGDGDEGGAPVCRNGIVETGEECDDGNATPGDGCEPDCRWTCPTTVDCDDGQLCNGVEACTGHVCVDGSPLPDGTACTLPGGGPGGCRSGLCGTITCGDSVVVSPDEECDDGNLDNTDACLADCHAASCGDGFVWAGVEGCDTVVPRGCATTCSTTGTQDCTACDWTACVPPGEVCNAVDDDCDGTTDEGFGCPLGSSGACTLGTCPGTRTCDAGCAWGACVVTTAEVCNAVDDDCDGTTDEGFACPLGSSGACTLGTCPGTRTCGAGCAWGACVVTIAEVCNAVDDDCDGTTDEGFGCVMGASRSCTTACGGAGTQACAAGTCSWGSCCAAAETCGNACDDDCDTLTDEGCASVGTPCTSDLPCLGEGHICNESWGICVVPSCTDQGDFTPCETLTAGDRSYDICVEGLCISPGCGDATCNAPGPAFVLADTGQRTCFDGTTGMACAGTAGSTGCETTAFCGQDAQYGWDVTHAAATRFTRTEPVSGESIVTDIVTGLIWQGCTAGQSGSSCGSGTAARYGWSDALLYCDARTWGGYSDWRLPNEYELQSLLDFGRSTPPLVDPAAFPSTPSDEFKSSSVCAWNGSASWTVDFSVGLVQSYYKTDTFLVRCVRGGSSGISRPRLMRTEVVPTHPVVSDVATGLMWQGCSAGQAGSGCTGSAATMTWQEALDYCQDSTWAGLADWSLPDVNELRTIADNHRTGPGINLAEFPATPSGHYWSSTSRAALATNAWFVDFSYGGHVVNKGKASTSYVRCVRRGSAPAGPCEPTNTWTRGSSPVLTGGYALDVLKVGTTLYMYGSTGGAIKLWTSTDGLTWTGGSVVVDSSVTGESLNYYIAVLHDASWSPPFKAWVSATSDGSVANTRVFRLSSTDGRVWTSHGVVLNPGPEPYDTRNVNISDVVFDGTTYHMWYNAVAVSLPREQAAYATSPDGTTWTKHGIAIPRGADGDFDATYVYSLKVVLRDGQFQGWYSGIDLPSGGTSRIGYARSSDGLSWTKLGVVLEGVASTWQARVDGSSVLLDGDTYRMWYHGVVSGVGDTGYASSDSACGP